MKMRNKFKIIISIQNKKVRWENCTRLLQDNNNIKIKNRMKKSYSQDNLIKIFFMGVLWYRPSFRLGFFKFSLWLNNWLLLKWKMRTNAHSHRQKSGHGDANFANDHVVISNFVLIISLLCWSLLLNMRHIKEKKRKSRD